MSIYYCILDFEATCDNVKNYNNEIIEFPSILFDHNFEYVSEFRSFVKPTNQILTTFCKNLTSITQENVDSAHSLKDVLKNYMIWIQETTNYSPNILFLTCGRWDLETQLINECTQKNIKVPSIFKKWKNIKDIYKSITKQHDSTMIDMLKYLNIELQGHHHSGIDDCRNLSNICKLLYEKDSSQFNF